MNVRINKIFVIGAYFVECHKVNFNMLTVIPGRFVPTLRGLLELEGISVQGSQTVRIAGGLTYYL
ncbi:uncharacterized protein METZ01_LOCUS311020 [marine metagenome]|uniref:Uncharacterized protein n=1 Tax=marine metagenome TaxID=408172 RepID=A0A382NAR7_9ZZZZ